MTGGDFITTGDGCRIAWRFDGPEGAPVLLLSNSLGTDMGMWDSQIGAWRDRFRILRYDQRGHGRSDAPAGAYSLDRLGRDVIELLDALAIDRVDFCGLSLGGMIGQWLGIRAPERLRRLVIANSSGFMGPPGSWDARIALVREQGMAPLAQASIDRWFTAAFAQAAPDAIATVGAMLQATSPEGYAGCCAAIRDMDMRRTAALISVPTLVVGGSQDPATPPAHSEALARTIPAAELVMLNAAHLSNVEQSAAFADACQSFLA
ncbi:3-oxoadipate enol-lactonase [Sphingobium sp. TA15]|uniref:Probable beta-ketoadipate enol-lactone hydrolase n=1 Tax=Sphingobium indicum (strain DSM 16413 / CCM 7287 / MTCC 6362 / UT26 / NBRC 101211 / UT26S) TaxID=452662 RepID=D4Z418_SPHIU|nr:3-oxoadipate enol-lactonase [Sphingobium indicum]BAI97350.1 probable beta-ketoadipate enol-lactone hydrolase [Sphingobium indicum UT26S]BDD66766.1 3-oxoadipate enol-lactonase [Sphingobium sp. TA15]